MSILGTVMNGGVVLDEPAQIPDGTRVVVTVQAEKPKAAEGKPTLTGLLELAGTLKDMPADFAAEHDHYIHGTPKRKGS